MRRILVVEDEPLIALDIATALEDAGFVVVGPVHSDKAAQDLLTTEACDAAILDVNLGGSDRSTGTARLLTKLEVPFIVMTGYLADSLAPEYAGAPALGKPAHLPSLVALVADLSAALPQA